MWASQYKSRAKCLLQLLWNSRPLIFWYMPLGPTSLNVWGIFTLWMCEWSILITIPNHSLMAAFDARKRWPFIFNYRPLEPTYFNIWGILQLWVCGWSIPSYNHQTKPKWLLWLLRKSRSFIFQNMPLGPTFFKIWGISYIADVRMINTYHHTKTRAMC